MPQLNLAAEVFRAHLVSRRRRTIYVLSVVLLLLVVGSWVVPFLLMRQVRSQISTVQQEAEGIHAQLNSRREEVRGVVRFRQQLALLKTRLDERVGWSRILTALERLTPPDTVFAQLGGTEEEKRLQVEVLVPNLDLAADFIASLQQAPEFSPKPFSSVEILHAERETPPDAPPRYRVRVQLIAPTGIFLLGNQT